MNDTDTTETPCGDLHPWHLDPIPGGSVACDQPNGHDGYHRGRSATTGHRIEWSPTYVGGDHTTPVCGTHPDDPDITCTLPDGHTGAHHGPLIDNLTARWVRPDEITYAPDTATWPCGTRARTVDTHGWACDDLTGHPGRHLAAVAGTRIGYAATDGEVHVFRQGAAPAPTGVCGASPDYRTDVAALGIRCVEPVGHDGAHYGAAPGIRRRAFWTDDNRANPEDSTPANPIGANDCAEMCKDPRGYGIMCTLNTGHPGTLHTATHGGVSYRWDTTGAGYFAADPAVCRASKWLHNGDTVYCGLDTGHVGCHKGVTGYGVTYRWEQDSERVITVTRNGVTSAWPYGKAYPTVTDADADADDADDAAFVDASGDDTNAAYASTAAVIDAVNASVRAGTRRVTDAVDANTDVLWRIAHDVETNTRAVVDAVSTLHRAMEADATRVNTSILAVVDAVKALRTAKDMSDGTADMSYAARDGFVFVGESDASTTAPDGTVWTWSDQEHGYMSQPDGCVHPSLRTLADAYARRGEFADTNASSSAGDVPPVGPYCDAVRPPYDADDAEAAYCPLAHGHTGAHIYAPAEHGRCVFVTRVTVDLESGYPVACTLGAGHAGPHRAADGYWSFGASIPFTHIPAATNTSPTRSHATGVVDASTTPGTIPVDVIRRITHLHATVMHNERVATSTGITIPAPLVDAYVDAIRYAITNPTNPYGIGDASAPNADASTD